MEMTDGRRGVFIDTNILIYASVSGSPFYQPAHDAIRGLEKENTELFISRQVLREYLASMTRPDMLTKELSRQSIVKAVRYFEEDFTVLNDDGTGSVGCRLGRKYQAYLLKTGENRQFFRCVATG